MGEGFGRPQKEERLGCLTGPRLVHPSRRPHKSFVHRKRESRKASRRCGNRGRLGAKKNIEKPKKKDKNREPKSRFHQSNPTVQFSEGEGQPQPDQTGGKPQLNFKREETKGRCKVKGTPKVRKLAENVK